ncbi:MAG: UDPGP type 1 family protein [Phycisphaerales bacterium]
MASLEATRERLAKVGQEHLLAFVHELSPSQVQGLCAQIGALDLERVPGWVDKYVRSGSAHAAPDSIEPAPYYPHDAASGGRPWNRAGAKSAGEALLRNGKVACFTVAGGQGSRLGYDGPKGCYPVGAVTDKPLFRIFAEGILATSRRYGAPVPWYVMTSPLNHDATTAFFEAHDHFGLDANDVMFFQQGAMPSFDKQTGKILLAEKHAVATNPDGHGGAIRALAVSGAIADMRRRGVEHVSYFQVDNPSVLVADPVFLGLHASAPDSSGEFSSKMVPKVAPDEKVGVFGVVDGTLQVVEYSDLPRELAEARDASGRLKFLCGNVAIHAVGVAFLEKLAGDPDFELPFHRAIKKVAHVDPKTGGRVEPSEPNAVKLEKFIFDAIGLARGSIIYETDRVEEFAPVKNAEGVDSVHSSKALQTERAARWLEAAGVKIPRDGSGACECLLEISPLTALDAEQLGERIRAGEVTPGAIRAGQQVAL